MSALVDMWHRETLAGQIATLRAMLPESPSEDWTRMAEEQIAKWQQTLDDTSKDYEKFLEDVEWIQWEPDTLSYRIMKMRVDARLPLCADKARNAARPWYRHCYACGLDAGERHLPSCPWVTWMSMPLTQNFTIVL